MEVGKILKEIRTERNLTQSQVAKGIMSRSHLSELENGTYYCSYDRFLQILRRLNISLFEFEEKLDASLLLEEDTALIHMIQEINTNDLNRIYQLKKEIRKKMKNDQNSIRLKHLNILCNAIIEYHLNGKIEPHSEVLEIKKYLGNISTWGNYEYNLMINSLFIYDLPECITLSKQLLKKLPKNRFSRLSKTRICLLINLSDILIKHRNFELAITLSKEAIASSRLQNLIYEECLGIFNHSLAETHMNANLTYNVEKYLEFFQLLGYSELVKSVKHELDTAKHSVQNY